eukprot:Sspe_Gene.69768::Locus_41141_Transcript_1_1_Confidence_1.000_Length_1100::g.69768::m.69768/K15285/SLC35E3; solute carrier family 35, member E3
MEGKASLGEQLYMPVMVVINILSVVAVVIMNKEIYTRHEFSFANTLMALHFGFTSLGIVIYQKVTGFPLLAADEMPPRRLLVQNALYHVLSVMFVNYSLLYNSVGMYQILKLANIPVVCIIEYYTRSISYSLKIKLSLVVLIGGIATATVSEVHFSLVGFIHGWIATVTTAVYQITAKDLMKGLSSEQGLYYTAPYAALIFFLAIPISDSVPKLLQYIWTVDRISAIFFSCVLAFTIQLTVFAIIGKTNPVTYQVVGHTKTTLVFICAFVWYPETATMKSVAGILVAMAGVLWYTRLKLTEPKPGAPPADPSPASPTAPSDSPPVECSGEATEPTDEPKKESAL